VCGAVFWHGVTKTSMPCKENVVKLVWSKSQLTQTFSFVAIWRRGWQCSHSQHPRW
jgi:hypothetical protein